QLVICNNAQIPPEQTYSSYIKTKNRYHNSRSYNTANDQKFERISTRNFHRIDLFGHIHRAQFSTDLRTYFPGGDQGCDQWCQSTDNSDRYQCRQPRRCAEIFQRGPRLLGKYKANDKTCQTDQG